MQPTFSTVQQENVSIFNAMEQVCVCITLCMYYCMSVKEIITAFKENFHVCSNEDDSTVQSEEDLLK